jgi:hypothetical protein
MVDARWVIVDFAAVVSSTVWSDLFAPLLGAQETIFDTSFVEPNRLLQLVQYRT